MTSVHTSQEDTSLWVNSSLEDIQTLTDLTVPEMCQKNSQRWDHLVAFECALTGRRYTHNEVYSLSNRFAASLINAGLKPGNVIAIVLPNCIEYAVVLYGIWKAGCIGSPMNPAYTTSELEHLVQIAGARAAVTTNELLQTVRKVMSTCPTLELIICLSEEAGTNGCLHYAEMVTPRVAKLVKYAHAPDDTCLLPFSSGTTGPPKGVMLTHSNLAINLLQTSAALGDRLRSPRTTAHDQERLVAVLPFFHIYCMTVLLNTTMLKGCHTIVLPKFHPKTFAAALRRHNPTFLHVAPPVTTFLVNSDEVLPGDLNALHTVFTGAAPTGQALITQFKEKFGIGIVFMEGYGMTELSPVSHVLNPCLFENDKSGSIGQPLPSTHTKIVDVDSGKTLGRYARGEICIKGPQVMKGYYKNKVATKAMIEPDGWLHTGDIGYYDDDGCLFVVDRLKELIKVKGFQVAPSELENLLRSHPKVADVAVIGIPHDEWGEVPRGYIVPRKEATPGEELTTYEVHHFLKFRVTSFKQLRGGIEFVQAIPKAASGKILRRELLQNYNKTCAR